MKLVLFGRALFALAMVGFGLICLRTMQSLRGLEPLPDWLPGHDLWAGFTGFVLLISGASLAFARLSRHAASTIGIMLLLWVLALHAPRVAAHPSIGGLLPLFETFGICAAAWLLAAQLPPTKFPSWNSFLDRAAPLARVGFGTCLLVYGVEHFVYHDFTADFIPHWIPARLFFAYFTGCAHIAAGLAIISGVLARLASILLGLMFGSWVLILHIPRVLAASTDPQEWTSLCVASALCGGAWIVAGSLRPKTPAAG